MQQLEFMNLELDFLWKWLNFLQVLLKFKDEQNDKNILLYRSYCGMTRKFIRKEGPSRPPRKPYNITPDNIREIIIRAFLDDKNWARVAVECGVNLSTARSIIAKYQRTGKVEKEKRAGRDSIIKGLKAEFILQVCAENPQTSLQEYQDKLGAEFPENKPPALSTINNFLDGQYVTTKQVSVQPLIRNSDEIKEERKQFVEWFEIASNEYEIVSFDEFSFHSLTKRNRGRSLLGERAVIHLPTTKTKSLNIILAISCQHGLMHFAMKRGTSICEWVGNFLQETSSLFKGQKICYCCDNARVHSESQLLKKVKQYNHTLHHYPRYSPQLNPVEYAINYWKGEIKKELLNRAEELEAIREEPHGTKQEKRMTILEDVASATAEKITDTMVVGFCAHALSFHTIAKMGLDFND